MQYTLWSLAVISKIVLWKLNSRIISLQILAQPLFPLNVGRVKQNRCGRIHPPAPLEDMYWLIER